MPSTSTQYVLKNKAELRSIQIDRKRMVKMLGEEKAMTNNTIKLIDKRCAYLSTVIQQQRQMNSDSYISKLNLAKPIIAEMLGLDESKFERQGNGLFYRSEEYIVILNSVCKDREACELTLIGDSLRNKLNSIRNSEVVSFTKPFTTSMSYYYFKTIIGIKYHLYTLSIFPIDKSQIKGDLNVEM